jgi:PAS domain S-box-containing protein
VPASGPGPSSEPFEAPLPAPAPDSRGSAPECLGDEADADGRLQTVEDALRASEHNLRSLLNSLPGLALVMDRRGEVELVNRPMLEYCGKELEELRRWTTSDAVHPDDLPSVVAVWQRLVDTGERGESTFRLRRADGVYRWFRGRSEPLRDGDGRIVRWSTLLTDIEEMQRLTEALQESEQRLRQTIDGIPAFLYTMAPGGEPEFFNRPILEYYGKTAEELMHWAQTDAIHPNDLARAVDVWSRAVEAGQDYALELRLRRADGLYRWFELRSRTVRDADGHIVRSYGLCTDIDDRKRAEHRLRRAIRARQDALRASARHLRQIVDRVPGLVYTMTPGGELELVNQRILDYFGRTLDELKAWTMTDAVHADDRQRVVAAWQHAVETGTVYQVEQRLRRTDGAYRWFRGRSLAVRDAEGRVVRWYGLLTDVDDEKRAQRRLRRAMRARFEAVLAERTRIAREMHDGLLQDLSGLALQLGAALPHVRTAPEAAADRLVQVLEETQRVNRAARDAVLGMRLEPGAVDLVSAVHDEAQRLTTQAGLTLSVRVSGPARLVPATVRDAAVSILHEALTNAFKHASASGVRVSVAFRGTQLRVSVRDDGRGLMTPGDQAAAAAHFGLVGMRERASSIGAVLSVSSAPGLGTAVRLHVPLAHDRPTRDAR